MFKDNDFRIRNNAATNLCEYVKTKSSSKVNNLKKISARNQLLINFTSERIFKELPEPLCFTMIQAQIGDYASMSQVLGEVLYNVTNLLLELENKHQQVSNAYL